MSVICKHHSPAKGASCANVGNPFLLLRKPSICSNSHFDICILHFPSNISLLQGQGRGTSSNAHPFPAISPKTMPVSCTTSDNGRVPVLSPCPTKTAGLHIPDQREFSPRKRVRTNSYEGHAHATGSFAEPRRTKPKETPCEDDGADGHLGTPSHRGVPGDQTGEFDEDRIAKIETSRGNAGCPAPLHCASRQNKALCQQTLSCKSWSRASGRKGQMDGDTENLRVPLMESNQQTTNISRSHSRIREDSKDVDQENRPPDFIAVS